MFKIFFGKPVTVSTGILTCNMAGTSSLSASGTLTASGTVSMAGTGALSATPVGYSNLALSTSGTGALSLYQSLNTECFDLGTFQDNPKAFYEFVPYLFSFGMAGTGSLSAIGSSTTGFAPTDCFEPGTFQDNPMAFYDPPIQHMEIDGVGYLVGILEAITAPIEPPPVPADLHVQGTGSPPSIPYSHPVRGYSRPTPGGVVRPRGKSPRVGAISMGGGGSSTATLAPPVSTTVVPLPQWIYDAMANPNVNQIDVPTGLYSLPAQNDIQRGNLTVDWHGSTLYLDGALTGYHFFIRSVVNQFSLAREYSHLTGQIFTATTQLTMAADEIVDVQPGEVVQIKAGVNTNDPNEPVRFFIRTVQSVSGQTVTFTESFGQDIPVYADEAALKAVVIPGQWNKIGPWGTVTANGSLGNGLGLDHGLIRYTGGLITDITFKNLQIEWSIPADANIPTQQGTAFFVKDIMNFSLLNVTCHNCIHVLLHTWRSDNILLDGLNWTGTGRSKIFAPSSTFVGTLVAAWGGTGMTYQNLTVSGRNMTLANFEISPGTVLFKNINYTMNFTRNWVYPSSAVMNGFHGQIFEGGAQLQNVNYNVTADSISSWDFDAGANLAFDSLTLNDPSVWPNYFVFPRHTINGPLKLGNITYGQMVTRTDSVTRDPVNNSHIFPPRGFYKSLSYRVTHPGSCTSLLEGYGYGYLISIINDGLWHTVNANWTQNTPNTSVATFRAARIFTLTFAGTPAPLAIEFQMEYYPAPDDIGWTTD